MALTLELKRVLVAVITIALALLSNLGASASYDTAEEDRILMSMLLGSWALSLDPKLEREDDPMGFATFLRTIPIDQEHLVCILAARDWLGPAIAALVSSAKKVGIDRKNFEEQFNKSLAIGIASIPDSNDEEVKALLARLRDRLRHLGESPLTDTEPACVTSPK